jgi:hypothetical protein
MLGCCFSFLFGYRSDLQIASGVGIVACSIFWAAGHFFGLYSLPALLSLRSGPLVGSWALVLMILSNVIFLLKIGSDFSRGSMVLFASSGLVLLLGFRWLAASHLRGLMANGSIGHFNCAVLDFLARHSK